MTFLHWIFDLTVILLMLRYETIIKPSFVLNLWANFETIHEATGSPALQMAQDKPSCTPQNTAQIQALFTNCKSRQIWIYLNGFIYFDDLCLDSVHRSTWQMRDFIVFFWSNHVLIFTDKHLLRIRAQTRCILMETFSKQTHSWALVLCV